MRIHRPPVAGHLNVLKRPVIGKVERDREEKDVSRTLGAGKFTVQGGNPITLMSRKARYTGRRFESARPSMTDNTAATGNLAVFLAGGAHIQQIQTDLLQDLLAAHADSAYGATHGFAKVTGPADYAELPFMTYDSVVGVEDYWSKPTNYTTDRLAAYFLTSGSSATPKRIPVTSSLVRQKARAFGLYWDAIYRDHPALKTGRFIANFGDSGHSERGADNVPEMSETTFWNQRMQGFQKSDRWPIPRQLVAIESAQDRYYAAARLALQGDLHCLMSLNPSTLVKFCETIDNARESLAAGLTAGTWGRASLDARTDLPAKLADRLATKPAAAARLRAPTAPGLHWQLRDLWPTLELILCWQSELVGPYLDLLRRHTVGVDFRDYITQSSECIMAIPMGDNEPGGLLAYTSHYYEFIPAANVDETHPRAVPAWALEAGQRYELVVTTGGGLYRYRTADCMEVVRIQDGIPHLSFQYRFGRTSSITGEKLTEQQVVEALDTSGLEALLSRTDVFVFPRTGERPHYAVLIDAGLQAPGVGDDELINWVSRFHAALGDANGEYKDKCASLRLGKPCVLLTDAEGVATLHQRFRAEHVGDDQYKPGILRRERDLDAELASVRQLDAPE